MHKPSAGPLKAAQSRLNTLQPKTLKNISIPVKPKKYNGYSNTTDRKRLGENNGKTLFEFSKHEIEDKIKAFIGFLSKHASSTKENAEDYHKEATAVFIRMINGFQKLAQEKDENRHRESPYPHQDIELLEKIQDLQGQKDHYEEKMRNHVMHTLYLEQKVTKLIEEYHNVIAVNERLKAEASSKQDTSIMESFEEQNKNYSVMLAETDSLRQRNAQLEDKLGVAKQKASRLEGQIQELTDFREENTKLEEKICKLNTQSFKMQDELDNLKKYLDSKTLGESNYPDEDIDTVKQFKSNPSTSKLENYFGESQAAQAQEAHERRHISISFLESDEEVTIRCIANLIQAHFGELEVMKKRFQSQIEGYQSRIDTLEKIVKEKDEETKNIFSKFQNLQQSVFNENERVEKSLHDMLSLLDQKVESLVEENMNLKVQNETSKIFITDLKNCVSLKNQQIENLSKGSQIDAFDQKETDTEANLRIKLEELERDIMKYQFQIEEYNLSIEKLTKKTQDLIKMNQSLTRDHDYLKKDFSSYRTVVQSVYMETKRHFELLKLQDLNVQTYFASPGNNFADNFNFLVNGYYLLRKEALNIDILIEQRRNYL